MAADAGMRRRDERRRLAGGGWRVAGVGDIQVDGVLHQERRWGAGAMERCYDDKRLLMGGR